MKLSLFDVAGPVMIGPSSSHTAGAARLARLARAIAYDPFNHVSFGLHGSFAETYKGHGTDIALLAGAMGIHEDDERLADAFEIAKDINLEYDFYKADLEGYHENTVKITFKLLNGKECSVIGSSLGGGRIMVYKVNSFDIEFDAQLPTLLISQKDNKGIVTKVSAILAKFDFNIGVMRLSRSSKGGDAFCIIETDEMIRHEIVEEIRKVPNVLGVKAVNFI